MSKSVHNGIQISRAGGWSFFLQIFYRCPATDSDVSDVDKRLCSIDKSDVSTSLTRRRRPRQSTLFSSNTVTNTAAIFSRVKGRHRQGARSSTQNSVSNRPRHSSMHVDDVAVATACTCMYYMCMRSYKKFFVEAWKSLRSALQNAVGRLVETGTFFGVAWCLFFFLLV